MLKIDSTEVQLFKVHSINIPKRPSYLINPSKFGNCGRMGKHRPDMKWPTSEYKLVDYVLKLHTSIMKLWTTQVC